MIRFLVLSSGEIPESPTLEGDGYFFYRPSKGMAPLVFRLVESSENSLAEFTGDSQSDIILEAESYAFSISKGLSYSIIWEEI